MENQIEEMARISCTLYDKENKDAPCAGEMACDFNCTGYEVCKLLFNKGYRKASDVAREIEEIIDKEVNIWEKAKTDLYPRQDYYCASAVVVALNKVKDNFKKKYEKDGKKG